MSEEIGPALKRVGLYEGLSGYRADPSFWDAVLSDVGETGQALADARADFYQLPADLRESLDEPDNVS